MWGRLLEVALGIALEVALLGFTLVMVGFAVLLVVARWNGAARRLLGRLGLAPGVPDEARATCANHGDYLWADAVLADRRLWCPTCWREEYARRVHPDL